MIGELMAEFRGKATGMRVLSDGRVETSDSGMGRILGKEATIADTGVATPMPNGVYMLEGNSMVVTAEGEVVIVKSNGMGWVTGKGMKQRYRGASYQMTSSPNLASVNKMVGVWEWESDENGEYTLKVWEWK